MRPERSAIATAIALAVLALIGLRTTWYTVGNSPRPRTLRSQVLAPQSKRPPPHISGPDLGTHPIPTFALAEDSAPDSSNTSPAPTSRSPAHLAHPRSAAPNPESEPDFAAFLDWAARRHAASLTGTVVPADPSLADDIGVALARRRHDDLVDLVQSDPRRALELALPDELRASLPLAITELLESPVGGRGDLEVLCALPDPTADTPLHPLRRFAVLDDYRYEAFVYGRRLSDPTSLDTSLYGIAVDGLMAVAESPVHHLSPEATHAVLTAHPDPPCAFGLDHPALSPDARAFEAFGERAAACSEEHLAAYELALSSPSLPSDTAPAISPSSAHVALASEATEGVKRLVFIRVDFSDLIGEPFSSNRTAQLIVELDRFYRENSFGRAGFHDLANGSAVTPVLRLPRTAASYGGANDASGLRRDARAAATAAGYNLDQFDYDLVCFGSVRGFGWAGLGFVGSPGAWIRGTSSAGVVAHELGHNYGLNHANFWDTSGTSAGGEGQSVEYGDKFDTMGAANAGNYHFNARYKRFLNWLQPGEFTVATTNGTYRIHAHDQTNAVLGSRGLQLFANARTNYWLELRQRFTSNPWLLSGAGLRWTGRGNERSQLLDTTPGSSREKDDATITLGRTFSDPAAGIHVTPVAKGGANPVWIDLVVRRGMFADNRPPTLELTPSDLDGPTTQSFRFEALATDADLDPLAYSWEFGDDTLGANTNVVTHRWSAAGDYLVACTVSDMRGGTARRHLAVRVGSPSSYRLAGHVTRDGEPVVGVLVRAGAGRLGYTDSEGAFLLTGLPGGSTTLSATENGRPFTPISFTNPLEVTRDRSDLDFAAVDVALTRPVTLVPAGSSWHYWDRGSAPAATWRTLDFDDSDWNLGPAILGYGGDKETTVVDFGSDGSAKPITTWFRTTFVVDGNTRLVGGTLGLLRDDGALVHLNGRELVRDNLPAGTITPQTLASSTVGGTAELTYFEHAVDPSLLLPGTNVLAVEIHQINASSSDIAFDLRLTGLVRESVEPGIRLTRPNPGESLSADRRLVLAAQVGDFPGRSLARVLFLVDGTAVGTTTRIPHSVVWANPAPGDHVIAARAVLDNGETVDSAGAALVVQDPALAPVLVSRGSIWRYLDTGIAPPGPWATSDFDDRTWPQGPARLGYGEDGEVTLLGYGSSATQKHITTWFRHAFDLADAVGVTNLVCRLQRDDGAAVYLNGTELFRLGLRTGALSPSLLALSEVQNDAEQEWIERRIPADSLGEGRNVLAVEVHQATASSSDLGFDLELIGQRSRVPAAPELTWVRNQDRLRLGWPARFSDWRLETSANLGPDAEWTVSNAPAEVLDDRVQVTISPELGQRFYRLRAP